MPYAVGTRVDFKKGLRASWQTGVVEEVGFHSYKKADDYSCVPLCRPCHERVTDTYALPGLTRKESAVRLLQVQVALLTEWAAGADALVAEHITVPILSRSAS